MTRSRKNLLNAALLAVFSGIVCLSSGCGGSLFPDKRTKVTGNIDSYRKQLEKSLLARYNNTPKWAGRIGRVELIVPTPPRKTIDGKEIEVEFDQLVFDRWNRRVVELEKEYFIVTFGSGTPRVVLGEPTINIGLGASGGYSENMPVRSGAINEMRHSPVNYNTIRRQPASPPSVPPTLAMEPEVIVPVPVAQKPLKPISLESDFREEEFRSMNSTQKDFAPPRNEVRDLPPPVPPVEFEPELELD